ATDYQLAQPRVAWGKGDVDGFMLPGLQRQRVCECLVPDVRSAQEVLTCRNTVEDEPSGIVGCRARSRASGGLKRNRGTLQRLVRYRIRYPAFHGSRLRPNRRICQK